MTSKDIVINALTAIFTDFDTDAASQLLAKDYIQHNPLIPTGADPIIGLIPKLQATGIQVTRHRVLSEDDYVVTHSTFENTQAFGSDQTMIAFDIFRVKDGKIAEHWDNLQIAIPASQTLSGNSMTDGATEFVDHEKTQENKDIVKNFIHDVMYGNAPQNITLYLSAQSYTQHNPNIENGLKGLGDFISSMKKIGTKVSFSNTPLIVAEGNFVFAASEGSLGDIPMAMFDLYRIENNKIVEHWDVVSEIPTQMIHNNGKF